MTLKICEGSCLNRELSLLMLSSFHGAATLQFTQSEISLGCLAIINCPTSSFSVLNKLTKIVFK